MISAAFVGRLFTAVLCGCMLVLFFAQYNQQFKHELQLTLQNALKQQLDCAISWQVEDVGLFFPTLQFNSVRMQEDTTQPRWSWQAEQLVVHFSWIKYLMDGIIDLHITLRDVTTFSLLDAGELPLFTHIQKFFISDSTLPIGIKELVIEKGTLDIQDHVRALRCTTNFSCSMAALPTLFKLVMYMSRGATTCGTHAVVEQLEAKTTLEVPYSGSSSMLRLEGSAHLMPLLERARMVHFYGTYKNDRGTFSLSNNDDTCAIHAIEAQRTHNGVTATVDASISLEHITNHVSSFLEPFSGMARLCARLDHTASGMDIDASMACDTARYGTKSLGAWHSSCKRKPSGMWHGSATVSDDLQQLYTVLWHVDEQTNQGGISIDNIATVPLPFTRYWTIRPNEGTVQCTFNGFSTVDGSYRIRATNDKIEAAVDSYARFSFDASKLLVDGALGTHAYKAALDFTTPSLVQSCVYTDEQGHELINLTVDSSNPQRLHGQVAFPLIKHLSLHLFDTPLGGQGKVHCTLDRTASGFAGRLFLTDSTIRLLQTHNFIRDFQANIQGDYKKGLLELQNFGIQLQKGQIYAKRCAFYFDDYWHLKFAHVPLFAHKLFLNVEKDMFVIFSGSLLGTYDAVHGPALTGSLVVDRGQVKKNIFSSTAQKNMLTSVGTVGAFPGSECAVDLTLESKVPLHVKTSVLDTQITCDLAVKGTLGNPNALGSINIVNGTLAFPYRSIPIVAGKLYFTPPHVHDPAIELVARGKVKKYHITMRVDGAVSQPKITFDASPPLTEEQIVTLLLSGSDDGSLVLAMPALVMHNVQNLLFGDEPSSTSHDSFIKNVLKPFKSIRIVPNFSDQQARGGIRGSLIIDLDDRFHALIQKNFSLPEDTRFEVEYHVSDDMTVRAIKDEHSDLGGEVEMRWKF